LNKSKVVPREQKISLHVTDLYGNTISLRMKPGRCLGVKQHISHLIETIHGKALAPLLLHVLQKTGQIA
jgi:hypothetical protein